MTPFMTKLTDLMTPFMTNPCFIFSLWQIRVLSNSFVSECRSVPVSVCPSAAVSQCPCVRVPQCPRVRVPQCPRVPKCRKSARKSWKIDEFRWISVIFMKFRWFSDPEVYHGVAAGSVACPVPPLPRAPHHHHPLYPVWRHALQHGLEGQRRFARLLLESTTLSSPQFIHSVVPKSLKSVFFIRNLLKSVFISHALSNLKLRK